MIFSGADLAEWIDRPLDFVAIDVETAARARGSICQIGLAGFEGGQERFAANLLVDPACDFDPVNSWVHGLSAMQIRGAPSFAAVHDLLLPLLTNRTLVSHSSFDRSALAAAVEGCARSPLACRWVDTLPLSRRAWPHLSDHRLPTVADECGWSFQHHNAGEDARAAGVIALRALDLVGERLSDQPDAGAANKARTLWPKADLSREPSGDGPLAGHCVVMTGDFSVSKAELADLFAEAGARVEAGVNKRTTILVMGGRDTSQFGGKALSGKAAKAMAARERGQQIEMLFEADARKML